MLFQLDSYKQPIMDDTEDSPSSLWMIRAAELFPKERTEKEDANLQIPFNERKQKKK